MSDLISKSALLDDIAENVCDDCYECYGGCRYEKFRSAIVNAPTVEAKPVTDTNVGSKWIPCSEKLPSVEGKQYIICDKGGIVLTCYWTKAGWNTHKTFGGNYETSHKFDDVVAWMPLPNAYNADRGGKND